MAMIVLDIMQYVHVHFCIIAVFYVGLRRIALFNDYASKNIPLKLPLKLLIVIQHKPSLMLMCDINIIVIYCFWCEFLVQLCTAIILLNIAIPKR